MCRIPRVVVVAPDDRHAELRRALSSLEYDIAAVVSSVQDASQISSDVAVIWEPEPSEITALRALGRKTVAVGGTATDADMQLQADDVRTFKDRVFELFRPA